MPYINSTLYALNGLNELNDLDHEVNLTPAQTRAVSPSRGRVMPHTPAQADAFMVGLNAIALTKSSRAEGGGTAKAKEQKAGLQVAEAAAGARSRLGKAVLCVYAGVGVGICCYLGAKKGHVGFFLRGLE